MCRFIQKTVGNKQKNDEFSTKTSFFSFFGVFRFDCMGLPYRR